MAKIQDPNPPEDDVHDDDDATLDGASDSGSDVDDGEVPSEPATTPDSRGVKAAKAFGMGLLCIVGIPVAAAVVTVGGVVYGAGKVLEGVGKGLASGPEAAFNAADPDKGEQKPTATPKRKRQSKSKPKPKPKSERRSESRSKSA
ncbi:hypothetical protein LXA43DRAFT_579507 [Ganoderma leucocontextum]|nr:hypothetical protein LXA43DRAFT_579507 [Ganoderma leucocontextum]